MFPKHRMLFVVAAFFIGAGAVQAQDPTCEAARNPLITRLYAEVDVRLYADQVTAELTSGTRRQMQRNPDNEAPGWYLDLFESSVFQKPLEFNAASLRIYSPGVQFGEPVERLSISYKDANGRVACAAVFGFRGSWTVDVTARGIVRIACRTGRCSRPETDFTAEIDQRTAFELTAELGTNCATPLTVAPHEMPFRVFSPEEILLKVPDQCGDPGYLTRLLGFDYIVGSGPRIPPSGISVAPRRQ